MSSSAGGRQVAVEQLAALIGDATGNLVPPARLGFLAEVAERRAWRGGVQLHLSAKEFLLLTAFMRRPGEVLDRKSVV